jgi:pre-mRNA-splicing factor ATP-dependent RNA helicase DHX15/PRP43
MRPKDCVKEADEAKNQFAHSDGDHITLLNAYYAYNQNQCSKDWCYDNFLNYRALQAADNIKNQLERIMKKLGLPLISAGLVNASYYSNITKCLTAGLFMQVAHLQKQGFYLTVKDHQVVAIHPSSVIDSKPPWILFQEFVLTSRNYVRTVSITHLEWLVELAPHYYDLENYPEGETKAEIEKLYRRMLHQKEAGKRNN